MFTMRFLRTGHKAQAPPQPAAIEAFEPSLAEIGVDRPLTERSLGRRDADFAFDRLFLPSFVIDLTELLLRRAGLSREEGFGVWAGTIAGGDALVSTLVVPEVSGHGRFHGEISAETAARLFEQLDKLDLVPLAQIHSHPGSAYLSSIDAERPLVAVPGFFSVIVPDFGFVDVADTSTWSTWEYRGPDDWHQLTEKEHERRIVVDPSILRVAR
jgi:proteasome lid subunit RPN8/RPN11